MKIVNKSIRTGLLIFACIAAWFLVMKLFGWEDIPQLRFANIIFAIIFSNRLAKSNAHEIEEIGYLRNFNMLLLANGFSIVLSVIGLVFYIKVLDPHMLEVLEEGFFWGSELTVPQIAIGIFLEGLAGSLIIAFTLMQYWKDQKKPVSKPVDMEKY